MGITFNFASAHASSPFGFFWAFEREMSNKTLAIHTIVTTLNAMLRHIVIVLLSALFVTGCTLVPESKAEKKAKEQESWWCGFYNTCNNSGQRAPESCEFYGNCAGRSTIWGSPSDSGGSIWGNEND
ncbi:MAG: hypothetical protein CMM94_04700 [Rickettsiales bacterium]|nr:hypothetical protein [Rickettsiales bacterium]